MYDLNEDTITEAVLNKIQCNDLRLQTIMSSLIISTLFPMTVRLEIYFAKLDGIRIFRHTFIT